MNNFFYGTGKRKTSISRVFIKKGNGLFLINKKKIYDYFYKNDIYINNILKPIILSNIDINNIDILITVKGGGLTGQSESITLGISRALIKYNIFYKELFKKKKLLTRDSRIVERKKYGFRKSRKKIQFSKR